MPNPMQQPVQLDTVTPPAICWNNAAARFYLESIARSDYQDKVGGMLRNMLGPVDSLLDVGAGSGVPGAVLLRPGGRWTAFEPNGLLADHLASLPQRPAVYRLPWQSLGASQIKPHAVVLAANMPGPLSSPDLFLRALLPFAEAAVAWVVSAQHGPRRYCLADFLPAEVHGEDCTPLVDGILGNLLPFEQPDVVQQVSWTFCARFSGVAEAITHFEERFNANADRRVSQCIQASLSRLSAHSDGSLDIRVPKRSACLIWRK